MERKQNQTFLMGYIQKWQIIGQKILKNVNGFYS